jgi:hypothetical protein
LPNGGGPRLARYAPGKDVLPDNLKGSAAMRTIEWEAKGVSRTPNPSTVATLQWPFHTEDNHPYREDGVPAPGKAPLDGSEERREAKP